MLRCWCFGVWHYVVLWVGTGGSGKNIVHFQGKGIDIEGAGAAVFLYCNCFFTAVLMNVKRYIFYHSSYE
jgi:hypothetical protein